MQLNCIRLHCYSADATVQPRKASARILYSLQLLSTDIKTEIFVLLTVDHGNSY